MIDREQVHKVALLARLEVGTCKGGATHHPVGQYFEYFEQLSELDVSDVQPTARAIDVSNVTRSDQLQL